MTEPLKTNPHQELIDAARGFILDVYGKAPKKALCGMTPDSLYQALYDMNPADAARQCKANPDGAASIRLAQAIRQAEGVTQPKKVCGLCHGTKAVPVRSGKIPCSNCCGRGRRS